MAKAKQTTQEPAETIVVDQPPVPELPGATTAAVTEQDKADAVAGTSAEAAPPVETIESAGIVYHYGDGAGGIGSSLPGGPDEGPLQSVTVRSVLDVPAALAEVRTALAPMALAPMPERLECFTAVSNIQLDGESTEAGGRIWLTQAQFDLLKLLGAIEGDWPD